MRHSWKIARNVGVAPDGMYTFLENWNYSPTHTISTVEWMNNATVQRNNYYALTS